MSGLCSGSALMVGISTHSRSLDSNSPCADFTYWSMSDFIISELYIIAHSMDMDWREKTETWFRELQDRIARAVEDVDGSKFREDAWARQGGGGGRSRVLEE